MHGSVVACLQAGPLAGAGTQSVPRPTIAHLSVGGFRCDRGKFAALGMASDAMMGKWNSEANRLRLWVGKSLL